MRTINRVGLIVRPKTAFFEWAGSLEGEQIEAPELGCSVYLVEASDDDEPQDTLQRHFKRIFDEQLESWHTYEADWPPRRTFAMFRQWFETQISDLVFDLSDETLIEYDDEE